MHGSTVTTLLTRVKPRLTRSPSWGKLLAQNGRFTAKGKSTIRTNCGTPKCSLLNICHGGSANPDPKTPNAFVKKNLMNHAAFPPHHRPATARLNRPQWTSAARSLSNHHFRSGMARSPRAPNTPPPSHPARPSTAPVSRVTASAARARTAGRRAPASRAPHQLHHRGCPPSRTQRQLEATIRYARAQQAQHAATEASRMPIVAVCSVGAVCNVQ